MGRPKNMENIFKPDKPVKKHNPTAVGQAGFDNVRENIDPHIKGKAISVTEGTVQHVPAQDKDIANKKYVDDNCKLEDGTASGQIAFWNGTNWVKTETSELFWDDVNKRFGIGVTNPTKTFQVNGIVQSTCIYSTTTVLSNNYASYTGGQITFTVPPTGFRFIMAAASNLKFVDAVNATLFYFDEATLHIGMGCQPATSGALDITSTTGALIVPRMTTVQMNALTAVNGMIIYDTTLTKFMFYENGAWVSGSGLI